MQYKSQLGKELDCLQLTQNLPRYSSTGTVQLKRFIVFVLSGDNVEIIMETLEVYVTLANYKTAICLVSYVNNFRILSSQSQDLLAIIARTVLTWWTSMEKAECCELHQLNSPDNAAPKGSRAGLPSDYAELSVTLDTH